jgi:hypothetical protein
MLSKAAVKLFEAVSLLCFSAVLPSREIPILIYQRYFHEMLKQVWPASIGAILSGLLWISF